MTKYGFRTRLFVTFSLLIASIATLFAVYFPIRGTAAADAALKTRAVTVVGTLANLVTASVEFDQSKDADRQLASVHEDADLVLHRADQSRWLGVFALSQKGRRRRVEILDAPRDRESSTLAAR